MQKAILAKGKNTAHEDTIGSDTKDDKNNRNLKRKRMLQIPENQLRSSTFLVQ